MPKPSARRSAIYMLDQILGEGRLLSELTPSLERLTTADRARAQRLTTETLRGLERADKLLSRHLRKNPALFIRNVLRLATVELALGGDAHGVVNDAVSIVAEHKRHNRLKGLVNAVLRKMVDEAPAKWDSLRIPRLLKWLRGPLVEAYDAPTVAAIEAAHFQGAPLDITAKTDPNKTEKTLEGTLLPTGSIRLPGAPQVSALPGYRGGHWWVQDAAAAVPAKVLAPQPGEKILDMCAAPGGKTLQLAAAGAKVTALDISEGRLERVRENLHRARLKANVVAQDALEHQGSYDAILLDAPCSATGTIRRHPDLPHAKDGSEFGGLIELQAQMLDHALALLKPGGRLVFCTCSLLPDEGECQVDEALKRHPDLMVDRDALNLPGIDRAWQTEEGGLRLRPDYWADQGGMDGFYIACLRKS
ncbi:RsmB/NOP family class I SAM-dependent RNA methyltransferase [Alisedimentitalea sp. MJ-SS2]|uniref:RsmB/NOP family class I SAM-dependent RNA methyltransferase n=1 Tax=Aliisedimentitalea sp. MJ-SS2 TaxID=3049795 RepID=UPI00290BA0D8|nr:RsmB/NOP family class I SAM-dependent RNA methyltransferase [Alisedimentitalea sp. MJ-SS2]MDU8928021.1 RsmB/NOP family class I SAM-dependent RNA methyltransferase [Alisedimentitalea sp. MJ-SS2]